MLPALTVDQFFKAIQEEASPLIWSKGVALTRGSVQFLVQSHKEDSFVLNLKIHAQPVSPKVTFWLKDMEWDCDCRSRESPCPHVVSSIIAIKKGELHHAETSPHSSANSLASIQYRFKRSPEGLRFERVIVDGASSKPLTMSLTAYKAGLQSRRLEGADVVASKSDYAVDQALYNYRGESLDRARLEHLFKAFDSDQKIFLDEQPIQVSATRLMGRYECVDEAEGYRLRRVKNPDVKETFAHGVVLLHDRLQLLVPSLLTSEERNYFLGEGTFWGPEKENVLCTKVLPALQKKINVEIQSLKLPQTLNIAPRIDLVLEKEGKDLSVLANIVYGNPPIAQLNPANYELSPVSGVTFKKGHQVIQRQTDVERDLIQKLSRELQLQPGRRVLFQGLEAVSFAAQVKDWEHRGNGFESFYANDRKLEPQMHLQESGGYSFDVHFLSAGSDFKSDEQGVAFEKVFQSWQQGVDYVPLLNGDWAKIPKDWMSKFGKRIREFLLAREAQQKVAPFRLPELASLCEEVGVECPNSLLQMKSFLNHFQSIKEAELPLDLTAQLRKYQRQGVNWLCYLRDAGLGAMLADDMGLGKTLQMMCALKGKSLIIAPTSVLFNWKQEILKFRPSMKVCLYYGGKRSLDNDADVVLTSYGVLRLDQDILKNKDWDVVVLDEAQTIKNPDSQVAKAAHVLRGHFKATLSGTPVENRLDDLWSQFQFINPGLLGSREDFLEQYARPIARGEAVVATKLKSRIKPFILRRLKKDVAPELPSRTEVVLNCELNPDERSTYEAIMAATKKEVVESLEQGGSVLKALEVILRLRQACCHMDLLPGREKQGVSSKVTLLSETLEESIAQGHKSLVFSQWTSFLDLIAEDLKQKNISYSRIDGSTANRQDLVNSFQSDSGPPVMLISLKAGGVGLTLTAADHVFIMDPWWNPAVEDQAADRAHRIGQQNPVMIHRLVARETIEERIIALQEKKKDLAKAVLDEGTAALSITRQDILDLLG